MTTTARPKAIDDDAILPKAIDSERQIAAAVCILPEILPDLSQRVRPEQMFDDACRAILQAGNRLYQAGKFPYDSPLLISELKGNPAFTNTTPGAFLLELAVETPNAANALYHADIVAEVAKKRRLHRISTETAENTLNGQTSSEALNGLLCEIDDFQRSHGRTEGRFKVYSAGEFAAEQFNLNYIVEGILAEGQPALFAGAHKTLKTSLTLDLLIAAAAGGFFLGHFRVTRSYRSMFCSGESGPATLQETANRICAVAGHPLSTLDNFLLTTTLPRFDDASQLAEFERLIQSEGVEIVGIDPVYLCMPGSDAGNLFVQGERLRGISEVCQRQGVTLILDHHTKRGVVDPFQPPELADIAWSGFAEFARQWILIGRREKYEPGTGEHRLWLNVGGSSGHGGLWSLNINEGTRDDLGGRRWEVEVQKADEARQDAQQRKADAKTAAAQQQLEDDRRAVCRLLGKHPNGVSKTFIRDHSGVSGRRWPAVFAAMYQDGDLVDCEVTVGNKKTPQTGYRLNDTEAT